MAWGYTTSNGYWKILLNFGGSEGFVVSSPYEPTIVENHVNGGSVIDLCLCESSVSNLLSDAFVEKEVELFTGAPSFWSLPNLLWMKNITKPLKLFEVRHDLTRINWNYLTSVLEVDVKENFDVLIKQ